MQARAQTENVFLYTFRDLTTCGRQQRQGSYHKKRQVTVTMQTVGVGGKRDSYKSLKRRLAAWEALIAPMKKK